MLKGQRKRVRRARRQLGAQQRQLLAMELVGVVAITMHTVDESLAVPISGAAAAQVVGTLLEVQRERQQSLRRREADELQTCQSEGRAQVRTAT